MVLQQPYNPMAPQKGDVWIEFFFAWDSGAWSLTLLDTNLTQI